MGDTCSRVTHVAGRGAKSVGKVALLLPSGLPTRPLVRPLAFNQVPDMDFLTSRRGIIPRGIFRLHSNPLTDFLDNDVCRPCRVPSLAKEYCSYRYTSRR